MMDGDPERKEESENGHFRGCTDRGRHLRPTCESLGQRQLRTSPVSIPDMATETYSLMKNGVFWDVTPCGSCKNRRFGGTQDTFIRVTRIGELGTLSVTSN
jgi:hypothetical protein